MIVINLFGGPGVGKSTVAATLFAHYKRRGMTVELAHEVAKEFLYQGRNLAANQVTLLALQYQRLRDIASAGTQLAICDSPIRQNPAYAKGTKIYKPLKNLADCLASEFENLDVLLRRSVPFQAHARVQASEAEARAIDDLIEGPFAVEFGRVWPADIINTLDPLIERRMNGR